MTRFICITKGLCGGGQAKVCQVSLPGPHPGVSQGAGKTDTEKTELLSRNIQESIGFRAPRCRTMRLPGHNLGHR